MPFYTKLIEICLPPILIGVLGDWAWAVADSNCAFCHRSWEKKQPKCIGNCVDLKTQMRALQSIVGVPGWSLKRTPRNTWINMLAHQQGLSGWWIGGFGCCHLCWQCWCCPHLSSRASWGRQAERLSKATAANVFLNSRLAAKGTRWSSDDRIKWLWKCGG